MAKWNYNNEDNRLLICSCKNYYLYEGDMVKIDENNYIILYDGEEKMFRLVGVECEDIDFDTDNLNDISKKLGNIFDNPDLLPYGVECLKELLGAYDVLCEDEDVILDAINDYCEEAEEDDDYLSDEDDCENCDGDCDTCEIGDSKTDTDKIIDTIANMLKKLLG